MSLAHSTAAGYLLDRFLATFGVWLRDAGLPLHIFAHAILGMQAKRPQWTYFLIRAWDAARLWKLAEPPAYFLAPARRFPGLRSPLPRALLRAMVSLCLLWDWPGMAALLLAGFTMPLRPGELFNARRCDLSLPCDRQEQEGDAIL